MRIVLSLFVITLILSGTFAVAGGGSTYSRYGIGDIRYSLSDIGTGMGSTGIGVLSDNSINEINPATWSAIKLTRFSLSARYQGFNTSDGTSSVFLSGTRFDGVMLAIPASVSSGLVIGMGFLPYSTVNYDITSNFTYGDVLYGVENKGDGGLSEGQLGCSWAPSPDFSFGAKLSYYFGTLRYDISQTFTNSDYSNAEEIRSLLMHGPGVSLGVVYSGLGKYLELDSTKLFTVGLVFSTGSNLSSRQDDYYTYSQSNQALTTRDTISTHSAIVKLPLRLGLGAGYKTSRYQFASDLLFQHWNNFDTIGVLTGDFRNSYRFSAGYELFARHEASASFFQHWAYRLGFFYDASYYTMNGTGVNEVGGTGGFGIPMFSDTKLNFALSYSVRGSNSSGLVKDKIFRLSFSLTGSEHWFMPVEEDN